MKKVFLWTVAALAAAIGQMAASALAGDGVIYDGPSYGAPSYGGYDGGYGGGYEGGGAMAYGASPWHSGYYHTMWGKPLALVVPPTLTHQTNWGWGVGNTRITPIYPQFIGPRMGSGYGPGEGYRPTPFYPSDTLQFGVYYIRGPW